MKKLQLILILSMLNTLYAEDLGGANLNYQKSRIKAKAENSSSKDKICYEYVEITNTRDWNKRKEELNTYIQNNKNRCKKYIIYKEVRNVDTRGFNSNASNNSQGDFDINLGVILEENPDVDIEIYTQVKNSHLKENGVFEMKANVGSIIVENNNEDVNIENRDLKAVSNIENSEVGQLGIATEYGLNKAKEFLTKDKDDPFND
ncbi:MAG TPA: hypothetical protein EYG80_03320 [Flavobacteriaceae bacterium]|nr:hypothetical protein [Flavobacteriaceae bacterium]